MKKLEWTTELSVGIEEIDNQHKELITRTNSLLDAISNGTSGDEVLRLLDFLKGYIDEHFGNEERMMNEKLDMESDYVKLHLSEHSAFKRDIFELTADIEDWKNNAEHIDEFSRWLANWYMNHIMNTDKKLNGLFNQE